MNHHVRLGRIFGITIGLHYSWFFIFGLLSYSLATGYFPAEVVLPSTTYWLFGALAAIALFLSVLLHELSHSLVALHYNVPVRKIILFFFGGVSEIPDDKLSAGKEAQMALAGPFSSLLLGLALFLSLPLFSPPFNVLIDYISRINLMLGFFNLIPAFPLDGGRVLRSLLLAKTNDLVRSTRIAASVGKCFALFMIFFGLFIITLGGSGLWFMLLGGFLYLLAQASLEQVLVKGSLDNLTVERLLSSPTVVHPDDTIKSIIPTFIHDPHEAYPVMSKNQYLGFISRRAIQQVRPELRSRVLVKDILKKGFTTTESQKVYALLTRMVQQRVPLVPVYQGKRCIGIIREEDILQYMELQKSDLNRLK